MSHPRDSASAGLVIEGTHRDALRTAIGALAGGHGSYCQRRSRKHHAWLSSLDECTGSHSEGDGHQRKGTRGSGAVAPPLRVRLRRS